MYLKLMEVLACPKSGDDLKLETTKTADDGEVLEGTLTCEKCNVSYPITDGIPRFVESDNYASSFGLQWNLFHAEQLDCINGTTISLDKFRADTGWEPEHLAGKWVLDAGCGAGRFMDVSSQAEGAEVVGFDISIAIDAARKNLEGRKNVHFVQASIYELPFKAAFDACYCIGVIQHTPDPHRSLRSLPKVVKEGGELAVAIYPRKKWTPLYSKYLIRPVTKRMSQKMLLNSIKGAMPVLFPVTEVAFRIPYLSRLFQFAIPVSNYVNYDKELTIRERYEWAIMDTFDMLAPAYDQPQRTRYVARTLHKAGIVDLEEGPKYLVCLRGRKAGPGEVKPDERPTIKPR